jgi:hypothetical protein
VRTKFLLICSFFLIFCLFLAGCKPSANNQANAPKPPAANEPEPEENAESPAGELEPEPKEEPAPDADEGEMELIIFDTDDGVFHILYPAGWATNQVPVENGVSFGIVPKPEHFDAGPSMFDEPVIMVYGSVQQVAPEMAAKENVENFHISTFYNNNPNFNYTLIGEPTVTTPSPYIIFYFTQAESQLSTGVLTHWMLGTALADQTVITFAVGLPDSAMAQYSTLAAQMFNSVEIDTEVTGQMAQ